MIVKWICRGLGEVDMGVNVDLIATWAKRIGLSSGFRRRQSRPDIAYRTQSRPDRAVWQNLRVFEGFVDLKAWFSVPQAPRSPKRLAGTLSWSSALSG